MKALVSFLLVIALSNLSIAQTTAIPDANFEQELIDLGYDSGTPDGVVLTSTISTVTFLHVYSLGITDLTGIEDFTALKQLYCGNNQLSNIDVTQNTVLELLACSNNLLTTLDISHNAELLGLYCGHNQLTNLDLNQNTLLASLNCRNNQLTALDVTLNIALEFLYCSNNLLTTLDLSQNTTLDNLDFYNNLLTCFNVKNGNNSNFTQFYADNNPNLTCLEVDDAAYSTTNWVGAFFSFDTQTSFSGNCNNPCTVSIEENSFSNLSIYPNPTTGDITIDLGENVTTIKATLTNNLGQVILTQSYDYTKNINLEINAPIGIYFLQIESSGGATKTIKIIKE
jgi:hypothetical protein